MASESTEPLAPQRRASGSKERAPVKTGPGRPASAPSARNGTSGGKESTKKHDQWISGSEERPRVFQKRRPAMDLQAENVLFLINLRMFWSDEIGHVHCRLYHA